MITVRTAGSTTIVRFQVPAECGAACVAVVGEFNAWSEDATPMTLGDDGFTVSLEVAPDRTYRFRYLLDGRRWENDWAAHEYVPNEYGGMDSVVDASKVESLADTGRPSPLIDLIAEEHIEPPPTEESTSASGPRRRSADHARP